MLLDLFCGAGGAARGYVNVGFDVYGVDRVLQPHYPYPMFVEDALAYLDGAGKGFDVIHASPPCQRYSVNTKQHGTMEKHPDLIGVIRTRLQALGKPYIIENVPWAPLQNPILLCGSMFGSTRLRRHRLFECSFPVPQPQCRHEIQHDCISVTGHAGGGSTRDGRGRFGSTTQWREIMGIPWMTGKELAEAIPPMYTEYIGLALQKELRRA